WCLRFYLSGHPYISEWSESRLARTTGHRYFVCMAFDVRGDSPLFRRISSSLAEAIERGDYPVGGQLPPEFTLMRMFGASRFTIREALAELRARGLIASRRGLGTVVLRAVPQEAAFSE